MAGQHVIQIRKSYSAKRQHHIKYTLFKLTQYYWDCQCAWVSPRLDTSPLPTLPFLLAQYQGPRTCPLAYAKANEQH